MTRAAALLDLLRQLPPGALVPVDWLLERLAAETGVGPETASGAEGERDRTIEQVTAELGRKASTIRSWCAAGRFPGAYRLNDREWRIPSASVVAFWRAQAAPPSPVSVPPASTGDLSDWRRRRKPR
jgi:hypothetical protein